jgi:hypothetical protein
VGSTTVLRLNVPSEGGGGGEEGGMVPWVEDGGGEDGRPLKCDKECASGGEGMPGGLKGSFSIKGVIAERAVGWLEVMGKVPATGALLRWY